MSGGHQLPERSGKMMSPGPGHFRLSNGDHHGLHSLERTRNEETRDYRGLSAERGPEAKWEYMGYGIWENRDPDEAGSEDSPPPARRWSAERGVQSMERVQQHSSVQKTFHSSSYNSNNTNNTSFNNRNSDNSGSASTATAGHKTFTVFEMIILFFSPFANHPMKMKQCNTMQCINNLSI